MDYLIFHCEICGVFAKTTIQTIGQSNLIVCDECYKNLECVEQDKLENLNEDLCIG